MMKVGRPYQQNDKGNAHTLRLGLSKENDFIPAQNSLQREAEMRLGYSQIKSVDQSLEYLVEER